MINYYLLMKPGIIMGNLITVAAGFLLASKGRMDVALFLATMIGLGLIIASACVFNNYIDRHLDRKMERTKNRGFAAGIVSTRNAIVFAIVLGIVGNIVLYSYTNLLTVIVASVGFFVYVVMYSSWKSRTIYGTAIGSIAGAVPPIVGYCAVSNHFDAGALILFAMLVLWQMPHFYSIAMLHFDDYKAAQIPLLPIERGVHRAKLHMVVYIVAFIVASMMLTYFHYVGLIYLVVTGVLSVAWLVLCLFGFRTDDNQLWGRRMFQLSLVLITAICFIIPFDTI